MWAGYLRHKHTQMRGEDIHRRTWYPRRDVGVRLLPQRGCVGNKDMARPQIPIVKGTRSIISILLIYKRVAWYGVYYGVYYAIVYGVHFLTRLSKQRRAGTNILINEGQGCTMLRHCRSRWRKECDKLATCDGNGATWVDTSEGACHIPNTSGVFSVQQVIIWRAMMTSTDFWHQR